MLLKKEFLETKAKLLGSLLLYTRTFFPILTGREFTVDLPIGRESHVVIICRALHDFFYLRSKFRYINIPPGHYKSTLVSFFTTWAFAHYPDCNFLYVSNSHSLASSHTSLIKAIMQLPDYVNLFGVTIDKNFAARDDFRTTGGGAVCAYGSTGSIVGKNSGFPHSDRFSGCTIIDDIHKPTEVHSDLQRRQEITNYNQTIKPRRRGENVGILAIGQRLHEDDFFAFIKNKEDGNDWEGTILKAIDNAGNVLAPAIISKERLDSERQNNEYVFWSQYQQEPQPAGGSIFKEEWFIEIDYEPKYIDTYITVDTAETDKTYNDATVFSFWGVYNIEYRGITTGQIGLHWIDCEEIRVEPYQLETEFMSFYHRAIRCRKQPSFVAIEKKSTGVTLISVLDKLRGISIRPIDRNISQGSKIQRFRDAQPFVNHKLISFPEEGKHNKMCITHCGKISGNGTHKHDDIADTLCDAITIARSYENFSENKKIDLSKIYIELKENQNRLNAARYKGKI